MTGKDDMKKENLVSLKDNNSSSTFWVTLTGQKGKAREDNAPFTGCPALIDD